MQGVISRKKYACNIYFYQGLNTNDVSKHTNEGVPRFNDLAVGHCEREERVGRDGSGGKWRG